MKAEGKEVAKGWGFWLLFSIITMDARDSPDLADTITQVILGLYTLAILWGTVRFLHRLVTSRSKRSAAGTSALAHPDASAGNTLPSGHSESTGAPH
ncbi:hypothetical protein [Streptomyces sp. NPDC048659]|uniref:hypothetical protein n=1 Tax=Streptomyces sp. NPDC048659 TaxID=3155489 RepID=UPI00342160BC